MTDVKTGNNLTFSSPAYYRICARGFLDESWSERFSGLEIDNQNTTTGSPVMKLSGMVRDQTELLGILNNIYEMHLPLISLEIVEN